MFHPQRNWKLIFVKRFLLRASKFHPQRNWKTKVPGIWLSAGADVSSSKELKDEGQAGLDTGSPYNVSSSKELKDNTTQSRHRKHIFVSSSKELKVRFVSAYSYFSPLWFHPQRNWKTGEGAPVRPPEVGFILKGIERTKFLLGPFAMPAFVSSSKELKDKVHRAFAHRYYYVSSSKELKVQQPSLIFSSKLFCFILKGIER